MKATKEISTELIIYSLVGLLQECIVDFRNMVGGVGEAIWLSE